MSIEQERAERFLFSLSSLAEIGEAIFSNRRNFADSLRWLLEMTLGMMRTSRGAILLYDQQQRTLSIEASQRINPTSGTLSLQTQEVSYLRRKRVYPANPLPDELSQLVANCPEQIDALQAEVWVSLSVPDRFLGIMSLGPVFTGEPLDPADEDFLAVLAHHISLAIYSAQLLREMRQANFQLRWQTQQLLALSEVSAEISSVLDPEPLMEKILQNAIMFLDARAGALVLVEDNQPVLKAEWGGVGIDSEKLVGSVVERAMAEEQTLRTAIDDSESAAFGVSTMLVAPIRTQEKTFGALLVCDKESREGHILAFDEAEGVWLSALANQAGVAIENARLYQDAITLRQMQAEMLAAEEIQRGLMPERAPEVPGYDIAGISIPRGKVGGDYYDYIEEDGHHIGLVIADVSGKGTQAALLMATLRAGVLFQAGKQDLVSMVLNLNDLLMKSTPEGKFATFFYASLDWDTHQLVSINAAHNPPFIFRRNGEIEELDEAGTLIGAFPNDLLPHICTYKTQSTLLHPGDTLLLYTDGVTEANNEEDEQFEIERLCDVVHQNRDASAAELIRCISDAVDAFQGDVDPFDDFTLVVVKRF